MSEKSLREEKNEWNRLDNHGPTSEEIASSENNIFEVSNLNVYYADFRAVKDVNMDIATNEITAFIGPSGCGKTTMLRSFNRMNDLIPTAKDNRRSQIQRSRLYTIKQSTQSK